jgi:hypothetical protein
MAIRGYVSERSPRWIAVVDGIVFIDEERPATPMSQAKLWKVGSSRRERGRLA